MGLKVGDKVRLNAKAVATSIRGTNADLVPGKVYCVSRDRGGGVWNLAESTSYINECWLELVPEALTCLTRAQAIVDGARREAYGHPKENHGRTAKMWSAYLGVPITERQVCMLNILQKVSRDAHAPKEDNLDDIAGWARNAEIVSG